MVLSGTSAVKNASVDFFAALVFRGENAPLDVLPYTIKTRPW
jgi:hypothetical protein